MSDETETYRISLMLDDSHPDVRALMKVVQKRGDTIEALQAENERLRAELASGSFYKESDIDHLQERIEALQAENHRLAMYLISDASRAVGVMLSCEPDPVILDDDPRDYIWQVHGWVQEEGRKLQRAIKQALTTQEKPE